MYVKCKYQFYYRPNRNDGTVLILCVLFSVNIGNSYEGSNI